MNLVKSSVYFLFSIIILSILLRVCHGEETENDNEMESFNQSDRFVRYYRDSDESPNSCKNSQKNLIKDKPIRVREKDTNSLFQRFDKFKNFLQLENQKQDSSDSIRESENVARKYFGKSEETNVAEDKIVVDEDNENYFEDPGDDDEDSKFSRSVDSSVFDPETDCDNENEGCKKNSINVGKDRSLGMMDTPAGNSRKTSKIALKAAQEAKAAEDAQDTAGKVASKQAKFHLAEKATQASKAASAALSAKQSIVDELERELRESETVVKDLSSSISQSESNANAAMRAAHQAAAQLKMLTEAVHTATSNLANSEQAAQGAKQELNEKTQLLEASKNKVEAVLRDLKTAKTDYSNTKKAAYKAATAAKQAKTNAARVRRSREVQS